MKEIRIFCPATIANISCGFDVLGACLEDVGDEMVLRLTDTPGVSIARIEGQELPLEASKNVAGVAAMAMINALGKPIGLEIEIYKKIKPGSGIGSSAASAAGVVAGLNLLLGEPFTRRELIPFAMQGEQLASGALHADNVAPALLGGFTLIRSYDPLEVLQLPSPEELYAVVVHPQIELRTADARSVLKDKIPLSKAITQWGNLAGLVSALYTTDYELLSRCLQDVIVEPLRSSLIPGFYDVKAAALESGALGSGISGSGPSIFALCKGKSSAQKVARAMGEVYRKLGLDFDLHCCPINRNGIQVLTPTNQAKPLS